ncbi:MAG TPA: TetR family transcriptional regulator [Kofleriaceae bacterium]
MGLRETKKSKTRLAISEVATAMFIERGFDAVTVAEVAAAAEVSPATIFNYFETKEDLFFDREGEMIAAQARVISERAPGSTIVAAIHRQLRAAIDHELPGLIDRDVARFVATVQASPALRARARLAIEKLEASLAAAIAADTRAKPDDATPRLVAGMIVGIERVLLDGLRVHLERASSAATVKRALRRDCDRAFALLEAGLGSYGAKR